MADHGYIKFYRSTLAHQFFRDDIERMAWLRLLSAAAWKPYKKRAGEFFVDLQRGEVVGAVRYLASEWQWSKGKVERFLIRLKNEGMIETRTETGITVITICKYNEFQGGDDEDGTPTDREPGHGRDTAGTAPGHARDGGGDKIEEIKHSRSEEREEDKTESGALVLFGADPVPVPKRATPDYAGMFEQWYAAYPKKVDRKDAEKCFERVLKKREATFEQLLDGARRYAGEMVGTEKRHIKAPSVWLNKGSWLNEPGAYSAGLPARSRADTAIEGIFSGLTEEDLHGRNR